MKQDRFLWVILAAIGILAIAAVGVFFMRQGSQDYGPDDTPEGVLRNYLLALEMDDFQRAYSYLKEGEGKPDYQHFRDDFLVGRVDPSLTAVQIITSQVNADQALVSLALLQSGGGPFRDVDRRSAKALLEKNANGEWKIANMPYPYWGWDWYQEKSPNPLEAPSG